MYVRLVSEDGREFRVERKVANMSLTIKNLLDDMGADDDDDIDDANNDALASSRERSEAGLGMAIPLKNVHGDVLERVLEFCAFHADDPVEPRERDEFDWRQRDSALRTSSRQSSLSGSSNAALSISSDANCGASSNSTSSSSSSSSNGGGGIDGSLSPWDAAFVEAHPLSFLFALILVYARTHRYRSRESRIRELTWVYACVRRLRTIWTFGRCSMSHASPWRASSTARRPRSCGRSSTLRTTTLERKRSRFAASSPGAKASEPAGWRASERSWMVRRR